MWTIKKSLLEDLCYSAQNSIPNEFLCFLGGTKENVGEIIFLPNNTSEDSASISMDSIPFDDTIAGSVHSHPFSSNTPSEEDKKFFKKYKLNIILGYPFTIEKIGFYNQKGEKILVNVLNG